MNISFSYMKNVLTIIGFALVLAIGFVALDKLVVDDVSESEVKIGAILPLTGSTAIFGENIRNAMELALQESDSDNLTVLYEDSEGDPAQGVTAYRKLVEIDQVNMIVSVFSRVSVPLVSLADADEIPFMMTIVSANDIAAESEYAFRFYNTADQYIQPFFEGPFTTGRYETLSVLYINDEFGVSVRDKIRERAQQNGLTIVSEESYLPGGSGDFRTQLTNIKNTKADALIFVSVAPPDSINIVRQIRELQIESDLFDGATVLSSRATRNELGVAADNVYVSVSPFVYGETGESFRNKYVNTYDKEPTFAAPYGYDIVKLVRVAMEENTDIAHGILGLNTYDSLNGTFNISPEGEINPHLRLVQIRDGNLVEVE